MAEEDSSQEKTEEATSRRLEKSREDGQIARSKELTTTVVLLAGTSALYLYGQSISEALLDVLQYNFVLDRASLFDSTAMLTHLVKSFYDVLLATMPVFAMLLVAAFVGPLLLGGWLFSMKAVAPKISKMDPIAGLKRMFSLKSLVELLKAWAKIIVLFSMAILLLSSMQRDILALSKEHVMAGVIHSLELSVWAAIALSAATILIAIVDIPFQIHEHIKKLKMTKQEVKDESKDTDGNPQLKGRIRQLQQEMANNRMMSNVPEADVVITNPTHYSVALKYNPEGMGTPIMVAKGGDHVALKIREIANAHEIEILESPQLARAIFHTTEVDDEIPAGLYVAVAQVLAYVFQLRNYRKGQGEKPDYPRDVPVPPDMRFD